MSAKHGERIVALQRKRADLEREILEHQERIDRNKVLAQVLFRVALVWAIVGLTLALMSVAS